MKKTAKAAAILAAMALTAGFCACQEKGSAGGAPKYSAKDAEKTAARLIMEETIVRSYTDGLPAKLVIPQGVTAIGEYAFSQSESITSVFISDSVTEIGRNAFSNCSKLASVTIGNGVTTIGNGAFSNCSKLASVTIGDSVTTIKNDAFAYCKSLKSVTIPASVTTIEGGLTGGAFRKCESLKSVTIPEGMTEIGTYAFAECKNLTSVSIPASVTYIGMWAFSGCENLKEAKYAGTKAQWDEIITDWKGRDGLYKKETAGKKQIGRFVLRCTDGDIFIGD